MDALTGGPRARMDVYEALDGSATNAAEDLPEALRPAGEPV
jgi:hypothetical protein